MTGEYALPPAFLLIIAGLLLPFLSGYARNFVMLLAPVTALILVWSLPDGPLLTIDYLGYELVPLHVDALSRLFATVFSLALIGGALFAFDQRKTSELTAAFIYGGGSLGVVFAGDLITVFIFSEIMAIASSLVVWSGGAGARAAGQRYAAIHFLAGVLLMAGVAGEAATTGSIAFEALAADSWPRWLMLAGLLINAGAPPFTSWLADAYPKASWSGTVFLSAFTTKTAVFVLIKLFPGTEALIYFGTFMVFYGIIFAILENDLRRVLVYSINNQVGFMLVAIGIGSEIALNGAAAHAFVHIVYKALMLMAAGAVLYRTGKTKATDLGGLYKTMPFTMVCGVIGALSISAFPYTSGFVAKSLITKGASDANLGMVWYLLTAASAGAFLYVGLKFPWFTFFHKDAGLRPQEAPVAMRFAMAMMALICLAIGIFPELLYGMMPYPVTYQPYYYAHIVAQLQLLLFSGLVFFLLLPILMPTKSLTLDFDWLYRGLGSSLKNLFDQITAALWSQIVTRVTNIVKVGFVVINRWHGPGGVFAETWPTGRMALWTTILLGLYLLVYFL
ncbi:MAG: Na(+)/H(+) antiporter subunit D [Pseudomonadota bacterium]